MKKSKTIGKIKIPLNKLSLNNKLITHISGPVFMSILKPNFDFVEMCKEEGVFAPVFILFGDNHENALYTCQNCNCNNKLNCCYSIDSASNNIFKYQKML